METRTIRRFWIAAAAAGLALVGARAGYTFQAAAPTVPPLIVEDFEATTLGGKPYLWKEMKQAGTMTATVGAERSALDGNDANKALKFEYTFNGNFDAAHGIEVGPGNMALPGSLSSLDLMVSGDNSKNTIGLRVRDRMGETFYWQVPITWTGWKKVQIPMDPRLATRGGIRQNGMLDLPLSLEAVRLQRTASGARKGEVLIDDLSATCSFGKVTTLFDVADGFKKEEWHAVRNRAVMGEIADTLRPRGGKDVSTLQFQYKYENSGDASVEFTRTIPAGAKHGTLVAEVFGDGSNNIIRFRMLDGADHLWKATWANVLVDWAGWKTLYLDTRTLQDADGNDPTAIMSKFPVKFHSLIVDDVSPKDLLPGVESGREGDLCLGRLLFCEEK